MKNQKINNSTTTGNSKQTYILILSAIRVLIQRRAKLLNCRLIRYRSASASTL